MSHEYLVDMVDSEDSPRCQALSTSRGFFHQAPSGLSSMSSAQPMDIMQPRTDSTMSTSGPAVLSLLEVRRAVGLRCSEGMRMAMGKSGRQLAVPQGLEDQRFAFSAMPVGSARSDCSPAASVVFAGAPDEPPEERLPA